MLAQFPAVVLLGPRQAGKTTLAWQWARRDPSALYLDLELPSAQRQLEDAEAFLMAQRGRLVVLDEVQRVPELFAVLRGVIDVRRRLGEGAGQFLLLGSASGVLLRQSSESLAGRVVQVELGPLQLRELPDETGGDLLTCAGTAARLSWLLEYEPNAQTKLIALDGLARMAQQLQLALFVPPLETIGAALDEQQLLLAQAGVQTGRPQVRPAQGFGELQQRPYRDALATLTAAPLAEPAARTLLVQQLIELVAAETDRELRQAAVTALRAGLVHLVQGGLLRAVQGRAPEFAELRLCAMEQIRRLGGPATVPLLLATMIASPVERAAGATLFDDDALVQLRLIHYCGQLGGETADAVVRLPGRQDWQTMSPRFFLATSILNEQAYYSKLRTPALVALTWSLGQPRLDPDPEWVRRWREGRGQ
jgi:hypothetical protein